ARHLRRVSFAGPLFPAWRSLSKASRAIAKRVQAEDRLLVLAATYVDVLDQGSRRPTADCAGRLGLSVSQVRDAVHQARVQGLLSASRGQGFAGGKLTQTALERLSSTKLFGS